MADEVILVLRSNDRTIIEFLRQVTADLGFGNASISISGSAVNLDTQPDVVQTVIDANETSITNAHVSRDGVVLHFERGIRNQRPNNAYVEPSHHTDTLRLNWSNQPLPATDAIRLKGIIRESFVSRVEMLPLVGDEAVREALTSHHQIIRTLEQTIADIGQRFAAVRLELEQEFDTRRQSHDAEYDRRIHALSEKEAELKSSLDEERQKLREREKELDDRDNTHVRREIRKQFKEHISEYKKAFTLTPGTVKLRFPIHAAVWIALALMGIGIWYFSNVPLGGADTLVYLISSIKPLGLTFAMVALLAWYLRWMTSWSHQHADAEFQLRQLELDMDRASWVVETALEWRQYEQASIPDHLLQAVSRNLFSRAEQREVGEVHPVDQLASALLGQAARAKLDIGGNQLEFERNALKKAGKSFEGA